MTIAEVAQRIRNLAPRLRPGGGREMLLRVPDLSEDGLVEYCRVAVDVAELEDHAENTPRRVIVAAGAHTPESRSTDATRGPRRQE